jgi:hypothetical protein
MQGPLPVLRVLRDYFVLGETLDEKFVDQLLGRVVRDKINPLQDIKPDHRVANTAPEHLIDGLMGNSGAIDWITESATEDRTDAASLQITSFLKAHAKLAGGTTANIEAAVLKTYQITQIPDNVIALNQKSEWAIPVKELFRRCNETKLPMITKVLSCESMTITYTEDLDRTVGMKATAPITAAVTKGAIMDGPADLQGGFDHERSSKVKKSMKISTKVIIGLAYTEVIYQPVGPEDRPPAPGMFRRLRRRFSTKDNAPDPGGDGHRVIVGEDKRARTYLGSDSQESITVKDYNADLGNEDADGEQTKGNTEHYTKERDESKVVSIYTKGKLTSSEPI